MDCPNFKIERYFFDVGFGLISVASTLAGEERVTTPTRSRNERRESSAVDQVLGTRRWRASAAGQTARSSRALRRDQDSCLDLFVTSNISSPLARDPACRPSEGQTATQRLNLSTHTVSTSTSTSARSSSTVISSKLSTPAIP